MDILMDPDLRTELENLITETRAKIPFHLSFDGACIGDCEECPEKLMEYLSGELSLWESRLQKGQVPKMEDIAILSKDVQKIYSILQNKGLV